ncbi:MAG: hypothetical protein DWQ01_05755 [Planctomycetota bacterium]|nr:MAG: hypothetical protein DWQ01_05755 [Planctomycetota bacterium]
MIPAALLLLSLISPGSFAQEPEPAKARWISLNSEAIDDRVEIRIEGLEFNDPSQGRSLRAALAILTLDREKYGQVDLLSDTQERVLPPEEQESTPTAAQEQGTIGGRGRALIQEFLGLPEEKDLVLRVYLQGDVLLEVPGTRIWCRILDFNAQTGQSVIKDGDLLLDGAGPNGWPMRVLGKELREQADGSLIGKEAALTTCTEAEPHYALEVESLRGHPVVLKGDSENSSGEDDAEETGWAWYPDGAFLALDGTRLLPLPSPDVAPGESFLGFRGLRLEVNDSVLGTAMELEFRNQLSLGESVRNLDWNFRPTFSSRRGLPLRNQFAWQHGNFKADWDLFYLRDQASDRYRLRNLVVRDGNDRYRIHLDNRWDFDKHWRLDADLAIHSDPLVDPEFFYREWTQQDDALSELYLRRHDEQDLFQIRTLYRLDDSGFTPIEGYPAPGGPAPRTLDTLPQASYLSFSQTLFEIPVGSLGGKDGTIPFNFHWGAEAGRYRQRDRLLHEAPGQPPYLRRANTTRDRLRAWLEAATPFSFSGIFIRPGARLQALAYSKDLADQESVERGAYEGFLELGAYLVRDWEHGWQHRVLPQIRFRDLNTRGVSPNEVVQMDSVDRIRSGQVVEFSLRQFYHAPDNGLPWMDLDVLIPYYPDPDRVYDDGLFPAPRRGQPVDHWGPAEVRLDWTPGVYGPTLRGVRLESRIRQDLHRGNLEEVFARLSIQPDPQGLRYGAAFRKVDHRFSAGEVFAEWRFAEAWEIQLRQPFTLSGNAGRSTRVELYYYGHDFVFSVGYTRDQARGGTGVGFGIEPRFTRERRYPAQQAKMRP